MKKYIAKLLVCVICVSSISIPTYAKEKDGTTYVGTENAPISTRAHEMEVKKEKIGNTVRTTVDLGEAGGQLPEGTSFTGGSGMLIWSDGGENANCSVSIAGSAVSFSLNIGTSKSGVSGKGITVPGDGRFYKLGVKRTVDVTGYKCYERLAGTSLPWKYVGTNAEVKKISESFYLIKVK